MNIPAWLLQIASGVAVLFVIFVVSNLPLEQLVYGALGGFTVVFAMFAGAGLIGQGTLDMWNSFVGKQAVSLREWAMERVKALRAASTPAPDATADAVPA